MTTITRVSQLWNQIETWDFREDIVADAAEDDVDDNDDNNNDKDGNDDKGISALGLD